MRNKIDKILLGLLWLLAATLGTNFWLNTKFGFNIFSAQHWQYLAYMQAAREPVNAWFYISLVIAVIIMMGGLYVIIRPRLRKIVLPIFHISKRETPPTTVMPTPTDSPKMRVIESATPTQKTMRTTNPSAPPRLNIRPSMVMSSRTPSAHPTPHAQQTPSFDATRVREIFTAAGYDVYNSPTIVGMPTVLFAAGTNDVLWVGAAGVSVDAMQRAISKLFQVFTDTLDDININVNAFVLFPTSPDDFRNSDIMVFRNVDELGEYIQQRPNPSHDDDDGYFESYSGYIKTVAEFIGQI